MPAIGRRLLRLAACLAFANLAFRGVVVPASIAWQVSGRVRLGEKTDPTDYLSGLAPAKSLLPATSIVGYTGDEPLDFAHPGQAEGEYYLAQFAVAPLLLDPRGDREFVLASFSSDGRLQRRLEAGDLVLVRHLVPGRALLRRVPQP